MRRHGWQLPLHPLQIAGIVIYSILVVSFYTFLGFFVGNEVAVNTVLTLFSFTAFSVMVLYIRCTAIDPSDQTHRKKMRCKIRGVLKLNYRFILVQMVLRFVRRMEKKIMRRFIKRNYNHAWTSSVQIEPLLPFPLVDSDDIVSPDLKYEDISFCSFCDFEVKKHSKHCRSCDRCVDGFDHHCRWLNNCIGKRNYTTFILLMVFVLLMFAVEGGVAIVVFIRCFIDRKGILEDSELWLHIKLPIGVLATISACLSVIAAYSSVALGQLFFFHLVLIRKGMRTYDYILAMKESERIDVFDDSDFSSDESVDFSTPERSSTASRFIPERCTRKSSNELSEKFDSKGMDTPTSKMNFRVTIDPWKLIKMSKEKTLIAAEKARERIRRQMPIHPAERKRDELDGNESLRPLPLEQKSGLLMNHGRKVHPATDPVTTRVWLPSSPVRSSPRRRFTNSPTVFSSSSSALLLSRRQSPLDSPRVYKNNFDLKLTEVSIELETYISKQVLSSILKKGESQESPM